MKAKAYLFLICLILLTYSLTVNAVEIGGQFKTVFDKAYYGDHNELTAAVWAADDILDLNLYNKQGATIEDILELPMNEEFKQEYLFNISGKVKENIDFNFDLEAEKHFIENKRKVGDESRWDPGRELQLDRALLEVLGTNYQLKLGDLDDFRAEDYFLAEKDIDGFLFQNDNLFVFGGGYNPDYLNPKDFNYQKDYVGLVLNKKVGAYKIKGKYYLINDREVDNLALEVERYFKHDLQADVEVVANTSNQQYNQERKKKGLLLNLTAAGQLSQFDFSSELESVSQDFQPVCTDQVETGTTKASFAGKTNFNRFKPGFKVEVNNEKKQREEYKIKVGSDYSLTAANEVKAYYTLTTDDFDSLDSNLIVSTRLTNKLNDKISLSGKLLGQVEQELSYILGEIGYTQNIASNIKWLIKANYLYGETETKNSLGNRLYSKYIIKF